MFDLASIQSVLRDQHLDAWLVYDFRNSNPIFARLFPAPSGKRHLTRRVMLLIPARGEPILLHSPLDAPGLKDIALPKRTFLGWEDLQSSLSQILRPGWRVAMEYVPGGALPVMSIVDAGTVELVRSFGVEVGSSANLVQLCIARWSDAAAQQHSIASCKVAGAKDSAFDLIRQALAAGKPITEREVQQHIVQRFDADGLQYPDPPIVAVNAHAGDPHFEVPATGSAQIRKGDWVLIDLWARIPGDDNIYSDITWCGFCGTLAAVPAKHRLVFDTVKAARDASVQLAQRAWREGRTLQGWELDLAAREKIIAAGFESGLRHRTGHSLSPGTMVHGMGVNLDSIETRDTRLVLPGLGWTVEPGIYLPEFGVRNEINMYFHPTKGPVVTSCSQDEIVAI